MGLSGKGFAKEVFLFFFVPELVGRVWWSATLVDLGQDTGCDGIISYHSISFRVLSFRSEIFLSRRF